MYLFVGTYAKESDDGIFLYRFNTEDGSATFANKVSGIGNPSYLALDKDETLLYSVSEASTGAKVFAYSFDKQTAGLRLMDTCETGDGGGGPCFIWVDSERKLAVTANYHGGSISIFPLSSTGTFGVPTVYSYEDGTPGSSRRKAPHLHCIYTSPDEKYLYANDLGTDRIYKYDICSGEFGVKKLQAGQPAYFPLPAGEGPRHTIFHPNGKFAYLISELSGRVAVLKYDNGNLTPIQYIEADSLHAAGSADIRTTPDGRFLYASNRLKGDGLAIFSIDPESGMLTKVGYQPTGKHPRNFIITPNGKFLLCACRDTNIIRIFAIDRQSGLLTDLQKDIHVSQPVCLKFASL
ncbi:MAG: lactonase family protein [Tannerella sp.]|nr:lactonase family protein [Tannerella sp.]